MNDQRPARFFGCLIILAAFAVFLVLFLVASSPARGQSSGLPDHDLTPGSVRVTRAMDASGYWLSGGVLKKINEGCPVVIKTEESAPAGCPGPVTEAEVCGSTGTRQYRHTGHITKREVCRRYGISRKDCPQFEDDHLIPLELGGSDDASNHFAEPWGGTAGAIEKDKLENHLRFLVCRLHVLPLDRAQRCIVTDWVRCWALAQKANYEAMGR
jgi:hypothetical protein